MFVLKKSLSSAHGSLSTYILPKDNVKTLVIFKAKPFGYRNTERFRASFSSQSFVPVFISTVHQPSPHPGFKFPMLSSPEGFTFAGRREAYSDAS